MSSKIKYTPRRIETSDIAGEASQIKENSLTDKSAEIAIQKLADLMTQIGQYEERIKSIDFLIDEYEKDIKDIFYDIDNEGVKESAERLFGDSRVIDLPMLKKAISLIIEEYDNLALGMISGVLK